MNDLLDPDPETEEYEGQFDLHTAILVVAILMFCIALSPLL